MPDRETMPSSSAPEVSARAAALPQDALRIASGYAFSGPALHLGALLWEGQCLPDAQIRVPLAMLDRHGLVAGATGTGTGKTKTLQLIAEPDVAARRSLPRSARARRRRQAAAGVLPRRGPGVLAARRGDPGRAADVHQSWTATGFPAEFYAPAFGTAEALGGRRALGGRSPQDD